MKNPSTVRVLVACECSQHTCCAFRRRGFDAYSCDIQDCYGGHPEWHIKGDCLEIINEGWDLVIAHPPCTYLSKCQGNLIFGRGGVVYDLDRYIKGLNGARFFQTVLDCNARFLAVENPVMLRCWGIRRPDFTIQPYEFGHPYTKATCFWTRNLPPLLPTDIFAPCVCRSWTGTTPGYSKNTRWKCARRKSETFAGVSAAMAVQWGDWVLSR